MNVLLHFSLLPVTIVTADSSQQCRFGADRKCVTLCHTVLLLTPFETKIGSTSSTAFTFIFFVLCVW